MQVIKILIVDKASVYREGLRYLLESKEKYQVIAEVDDGLQCAKKNSWFDADLILVNAGIRDLDAILKNIYCESGNKRVRILMLAGIEDIRRVWEKVDSGIDGYILKESGFGELEKAIDAVVVRGERYVDQELEMRLEERENEWGEEREKIARLTKRELDVLRNLAIGMYNKEIALKLAISERTVKNHVSNIFKKIGVADRTQAAVFAIRNCLVEI